MRSWFKWLGIAMVTTGVAVFPMVIWFPGPWAVIALLLVMAGCVLLLLGPRTGSGNTSDEA